MEKVFKLAMLALILMTIPGKTLADSAIEVIMQDAHNAGIFPGASLYIGKLDQTLLKTSIGDSHQVIYDVASLTKVIVTTTLVMKLEEQGKIHLTDKVSTHFPHFKADSTIEDLLRHRAGLPSGARPKTGEEFDDYIKRICSADLAYEPGTKTVYSDLSFILLGKLVEKISGYPLDELARQWIFEPLKMKSSFFVVPEPQRSQCAPTTATKKCEVHDPTAFHLLPHHVGNAGLFSNLDDLIPFVRMILGGGEVDGVRILSKATVKKMLVKEGPRGLGWDYESEFSTAPRGDVFPLGVSFGHTGYTGTTIWIDPVTQSFYIFLSNRVYAGDERTKQPFSEFRKKLSTAIGNQIYNL